MLAYGLRPQPSLGASAAATASEKSFAIDAHSILVTVNQCLDGLLDVFVHCSHNCYPFFSFCVLKLVFSFSLGRQLNVSLLFGVCSLRLLAHFHLVVYRYGLGDHYTNHCHNHYSCHHNHFPFFSLWSLFIFLKPLV